MATKSFRSQHQPFLPERDDMDLASLRPGFVMVFSSTREGAPPTIAKFGGLTVPSSVYSMSLNPREPLPRWVSEARASSDAPEDKGPTAFKAKPGWQSSSTISSGDLDRDPLGKKTSAHVNQSRMTGNIVQRLKGMF
jgi:hypothetical protein